MWSDLFAGVSLVGSGIQAGALLMFLLGVCPTLAALPLPEWMRLHVALDRSIERYMPGLNLVTSAAALALLFVAQEPQVRALRVLALAHNVALAVISEAVNVRINKRIAARVPATVGAPAPADTADGGALRDRWIRWHRIRTAVIVVGFAQYVVAILWTTG
jgi:uncharacterized membrane protein